MSASPTRSSSTWPSRSMEKQYEPIDSFVGRDSNRVMLIPRAANCSSSASNPPAWSSRWKSTTVVLSAPVRSGTTPGRATSTNRVTAACMSPIPSASTSSPWSRAAAGAHTAASNGCGPCSKASAAEAVDSVGTYTASGRFSPIQPRTCAHAWEWVPTARTASRVVPGAAASTKVMGTSTSPTTTSGSPLARASSVAETPPSTEFSIGTMAASMAPERRAVSAASTDPNVTRSPCADGPHASRAIDVNVPSGPRKP
jgi:hypothetical protein